MPVEYDDEPIILSVVMGEQQQQQNEPDVKMECVDPDPPAQPVLATEVPHLYILMRMKRK